MEIQNEYGRTNRGTCCYRSWPGTHCARYGFCLAGVPATQNPWSDEVREGSAEASRGDSRIRSTQSRMLCLWHYSSTRRRHYLGCERSRGGWMTTGAASILTAHQRIRSWLPSMKGTVKGTAPALLRVRRRWSVSTSFVRLGADSSTLLVRVSPGERFGRLSFEDLMETASPGDGSGGLTPKRLPSPEDCLSARRGASRGTAAVWPPEYALSPHVGVAADEDKGRVMCWE